MASDSATSNSSTNSNNNSSNIEAIAADKFDTANVRRVKEALSEGGLAVQIKAMEESARTAQMAADAIGCQVAQIVKSLVFKAQGQELAVLALVSGANRLDEKLVEEQLGFKLEKANAAFVRDMTGFAIGGVAVGEPHEEMMKAVSYTIPYLPENSPKHLLGVGTPFDIVQAVGQGCDTFDCVIPMREARHGRLYISSRTEDGKEAYSTIDVRLAKYAEDFTPIDSTCNCYACLNHTKAYVNHLIKSGEMLGARLATMHNLRFYLNLMEKIRQAIQYDYFEDILKDFREIKEK